MIILDIEQGAPEWYAARAGIPTASQFKRIVTTTGAPSKSAQDYAFTLAGERISGRVEESYSNAAMQRGTEMEPVAREMYEFLTGNAVQQVGLAYKDEDRKYSCSPDGLIGSNGGLEIKCPSMGVHTKYLYGGKCPSDYYQQVQGSLFITGREWWDFFSYYPDMEPLLVRSHPDEKFFAALQVELDKFSASIDAITRKIMEG